MAYRSAQRGWNFLAIARNLSQFRQPRKRADRNIAHATLLKNSNAIAHKHRRTKFHRQASANSLQNAKHHFSLGG